ncbi:PIG-L deacetylase family protein [Thermodesulfobacteriota bacterium]
MKNLFNGKRPISLYSVSVPKNLRILSFAPHPDDFDDIGVTMRFLKDNGNPIYVGVISSGAGGVDDSFCTPPTLLEKRNIRESEQRNSCKFFGLPEDHLTFLRLQEDSGGHPQDTTDNFQKTKDFILRVRPDLVFLPHGNDSNSGHQQAYIVFKKIVLQAGYPVTAILNRDPKTINMRVDLYTPFGEKESEWKGKLLRFHKSQQQRNLTKKGYGFDERILNVNHQTAKEIDQKVLYAEAFELRFFQNSQPASG